MKSVHEGDTLVTWKLDRLARSALKLIDTVASTLCAREAPRSEV